MKNYWMHAALALALGITSQAYAGQAAPKSNDAAVLLQAAMHTEQVEGRLPEAIDAYKNVVARAGANKAVAAQALLRLGAAYERLGRPEAREAYERVVRNYPDRPKEAAAAKARLAKVGGGAVKKAQVDIIPRKVLDGHEASVFDITPDGRLGVGTTRSGLSRFDVVLRDLTTGKVTVLVPGDGEPGKSGSWPRISDDGKHVAYQWRDGDVSSVRIVSTDPGATPKVIASASGKILAPMDWAPDGSAVLTAILTYTDATRTKRSGTELVWHPLDGGTPRPVKQLAPWIGLESFAKSPKVSPDGRYIAVVLGDRADSPDSYLHVIESDGSGESVIVASAGERRSYPMWTRDGGAILYTEGAVLSPTLWSVPVRAGQRAGEPSVLHRNLVGTPMGLTSAGTLLTRTLGEGPQVYLTDRRPSPGSHVSTFEGLNPSFSKDGRYLAYMRWGVDSTSLIVREIESGREQTYKAAKLLDPAPDWRHDGSALLVTMLEGAGGSATRVAALLDLQSGSTTRLFDRQGPDRERSRGPLSLDGKTVYIARTDAARAALVDIVSRDLTTGSEQIVASLDPSPTDRAEVGLALSPDGRTLAVAHWKTKYESARMFTVGVDGTGLRELVPSYPTAWISEAIHWTPDGQSVLFVASDVRKNWRVMRVGANGGTPEPDGLAYETLDPLVGSPRLEPSNFIGFDLSPDGSRVVASTRTRAMSEVWALDVAALLAAK